MPIGWAHSLMNRHMIQSQALREVIGVIHLVEKMKQFSFEIQEGTPKIRCKTFEDNESSLKIVTNHKNKLRNKHLPI